MLCRGRLPLPAVTPRWTGSSVKPCLPEACSGGGGSEQASAVFMFIIPSSDHSSDASRPVKHRGQCWAPGLPLLPMEHVSCPRLPKPSGSLAFTPQSSTPGPVPVDSRGRREKRRGPEPRCGHRSRPWNAGDTLVSPHERAQAGWNPTRTYGLGTFLRGFGFFPWILFAWEAGNRKTSHAGSPNVSFATLLRRSDAVPPTQCAVQSLGHTPYTDHVCSSALCFLI